MPSKKHKLEKIVGKLRAVDIVLGQGETARWIGSLVRSGQGGSAALRREQFRAAAKFRNSIVRNVLARD